MDPTNSVNDQTSEQRDNAMFVCLRPRRLVVFCDWSIHPSIRTFIQLVCSKSTRARRRQTDDRMSS